MTRPVRALAALLCVLPTVLLAAPAQAAYSQIEGSGSTWSEVILQQWISDVDANGMKVTYNGGGSSQGRKNFAQNVTDFGITEIPYQGTDEFGNADTAGGREFAYMPIVAGGTAFTYQVRVAGELVRNLRLSGETIAKIFTNQITNWNDPAITKDNNGRALPSLAITPVVRSDGSGTTAQFTTWMDKVHPAVWRPFFGRSGLTSYYPRKGRAIAASGSDQVMNTISGAAGNGTIGYVEYSYPLNKKYPVVKVLNKAGYFVEPTQYNVAVALTHAKINQDKGSQLYLTQILDEVYRAPEEQAYPLSSYSYLLLPVGANDQRMTTSKRQTLGDFMYYSVCEGQSKAGPYGYSPLPLNLVKAGFEQLAKLKKADPGVDLRNRDVTRCNNPTFDPKNPGSNRLATIAPMPAACDRLGAGPCGTATGTGGPAPGEKGTAGAAAGPAAGTGDTAGRSAGRPGDRGAAAEPGAGVVNGAGALPADAEVVVDPETGLVSTGTVAAGPVTGVPTELMYRRDGEGRVFGALAAVQLVALVVLPGLVATLLRRRAAGVR